MGVIGEVPWLTDDTGAVRVRVGQQEWLVVEADWREAAGIPQGSTEPLVSGLADETSPTPGQWTTVLDGEFERQEAYVSNNHPDPGAIVLVAGGPYGVKPIWPGGPSFVTSSWKGSIQVMSPGHSSVRISVAEV